MGDEEATQIGKGLSHRPWQTFSTCPGTIPPSGKSRTENPFRKSRFEAPFASAIRHRLGGSCDISEIALRRVIPRGGRAFALVRASLRKSKPEK